MLYSALVLCSLLVPAGDDAWPDYRGPHRDGHAPVGSALPLEWSEEQGVAWKTAIHGQGWSTPVIGEGRVWITTATEDGGELFAIALDLETGRVLHDRRVFAVEDPATWRNDMNSHASPSPVIEEGRVYVHFGTNGTACLDVRSGATLWERRDINCDHMEGPGSSPILHEDLLIFNADGGDVQFVTALAKATGATVWSTPRSVDYSGMIADRRKAYSTPIVVSVAGREELVSSGAEATMAYDPRTGKELWKVAHKGFSMSSRPVTADGLVFVNTGFMQPQLWALRLGPLEGEAERALWKVSRAVPTIPSPVLAEGRIYLVSDGGIASCLDAATGAELWRERLDGEYAASPLYLPGDSQTPARVYFFNREGRTTVVAAGVEFAVLAENELDDGCMASPAVAGDTLVLRTRTHVYRIASAK